MNTDKVCDICRKTPCECEVSESDYEYGEPDFEEENCHYKNARDMT